VTRIAWALIAACGCAPAPTTATVTLTSGAYLAPPHSDTTVCQTLRLPADRELDVTAIDASLSAGGGHHVIFYRSTEPTETEAPAACDLLSDLAHNVPLLITNGPVGTLTLPDGVVHHFDAGERVKVEVHALNATDDPIEVEAKVTLTLAPAGAPTVRAGTMFCGSVAELTNRGLPPAIPSVAIAPGFFAGNDAIDLTALRVFALATHQHWTGQEVTIAKSTGANDRGQLVYDNTSWDAPRTLSLPAGHPLTFAAGEGLRWQCSYDTIDASPPPIATVHYGERLRADEMCFLWIQYAPDIGRPIGSTDCWQ
jgi:hypothetical protein